ncbi:mechanosensitive ion channel family protein [Salisaeta longa]|uniref:mechanosensitive ion channel family protein n=1 Tax=Salisaeta longa TaxID=503170 RepID=UPI0003B778E4|nr:mechanosensitive ion channel family protein [Salisaeta longa]
MLAQLQQFTDRLTDVGLWQTLLTTGLRIAVILVLAVVGLRLIKRFTNSWTERSQDLEKDNPRRLRIATLSNLIQSAAHYIIWPLALIMILSEVNIDVGALLATAGIAGLAVGFGAQTLVKDVISGIFLLFDDIIHVGDLVRMGNETGTVEEIGVRLIKIRKFDGELLMVPAGDLRTFGNKNIGFARAIVEVGLSYDQDIDAILPIMEHVARSWAEVNQAILLEEEPQVQAITLMGDSSLTARIVVQVKPGEQFAAERDLRVRLKRAFDEHEVTIPFPQRTLRIINDEEKPPRAPKAAADQEAPGTAAPDGASD